jgi:acetyl esterase/lipase
MAWPRVQLPDDIAHETLSADGVPCERLVPTNGRTDQALLYLHGGGFVYGLTPLHMQMVAHLARRMGVQALLVEYRLAPDHPFPAALDDCLTAYRWLRSQGIPARNIVMAGDSAGAT